MITIATIRIVSEFCYLILQLGTTPIFIASCMGHDKVVEVLIAAGAEVNLADKVS